MCDGEKGRKGEKEKERKQKEEKEKEKRRKEKVFDGKKEENLLFESR